MSFILPRILVSSNDRDPDSAINYADAVRVAGGEPVVEYAPSAAEPCFDALLLTGGCDVAPARYGQQTNGSNAADEVRDEAELALFHAYLKAGKPILGICRGHQVINVALGGTLIQDLGEPLNSFHRKVKGSDDRVHAILAQSGSVLNSLYGDGMFLTNSAHHQAVDIPGNGLRVAACSESGVVESIELPDRFVLGVQFHPERMTGAHLRSDCVDGAAVFHWLIAACQTAVR